MARPTVFADVGNGMAIAREHIFGPVVCLILYDDEAEAIAFVPLDLTAPFGGFKRSGNGREYGAEGMAKFLEGKAVCR
ncbi:acyl-CoA reductase-like NAD-dependent aldehyde dehydrogenase [Cupriavidus necator]|nr:acyl-CoA reductase-like NAD-dependent aldehyde dehydrogenase [Cupriavidus necator]